MSGANPMSTNAASSHQLNVAVPIVGKTTPTIRTTSVNAQRPAKQALVRTHFSPKLRECALIHHPQNYTREFGSATQLRHINRGSEFMSGVGRFASDWPCELQPAAVVGSLHDPPAQARGVMFGWRRRRVQQAADQPEL